MYIAGLRTFNVQDVMQIGPLVSFPGKYNIPWEIQQSPGYLYVHVYKYVLPMPQHVPYFWSCHKFLKPDYCICSHYMYCVTAFINITYDKGAV